MSDRLFVATRKGLFTLEATEARGPGWVISKTAFLGDNVSYVLPDARDGFVYAALDHGHFGVKLHRSVDNGENWEEVAVPVYPEKPEGEPDTINPMSQKVIPWSLKLIWSLVPGGADQPGKLWCGTLPGGLFVSEDRGLTWAMVRSLWDRPERKQWFGGGFDEAGIHSICVHPADSNHVAVGISCAGVWVTKNGGETWDNMSKGMRAEYMPPEKQYDPNVQDPHRVVQCPSNPEVLWAQHHNGIFLTTDGCASWVEIKNVQPSSFGFAVAVHPREPNTAWFVPAIKDEKRIPVDGKVVVTRTRNGGESFEVLDSGLPQEHAYDLVLRHALAIDETGDRLAMGSTTGSLWVSQDQGDAWRHVTAHLPPVYCVAFA